MMRFQQIREHLRAITPVYLFTLVLALSPALASSGGDKPWWTMADILRLGDEDLLDQFLKENLDLDLNRNLTGKDSMPDHFLGRVLNAINFNNSEILEYSNVNSENYENNILHEELNELYIERERLTRILRTLIDHGASLGAVDPSEYLIDANYAARCTETPLSEESCEKSEKFRNSNALTQKLVEQIEKTTQAQTARPPRKNPTSGAICDIDNFLHEFYRAWSKRATSTNPSQYSFGQGERRSGNCEIRLTILSDRNAQKRPTLQVSARVSGVTDKELADEVRTQLSNTVAGSRTSSSAAASGN